MASRSPATDSAERVELAAAREQLLFVGRVVGERADQALRRIHVPGGEGAAGLGNAVRRDVADHARQLLLDVPAQMAREQQHFGREPGVALDFDGAQRMLLAAAERGEQLGLQGHRKRRIGAARFHRAPLQDAQA